MAAPLWLTLQPQSRLVPDHHTTPKTERLSEGDRKGGIGDISASAVMRIASHDRGPGEEKEGGIK